MTIQEEVEREAMKLLSRYAVDVAHAILQTSALREVAQEIRALRDSVEFFTDQYRQRS